MRESLPTTTAPSSDRISLHCAQRIAERTSYSAGEVQELRDRARTATISKRKVIAEDIAAALSLAK